MQSLEEAYHLALRFENWEGEDGEKAWEHVVGGERNINSPKCGCTKCWLWKWCECCWGKYVWSACTG